MVVRLGSLSSAVGLRTRTDAPYAELDLGRIVGVLWQFLQRHREHLWIASILLVAGLAHGINMYNLPYFENDEGTYMSQAWSVLAQGQLAPYTYWYDHAPLGWIQIAGWTFITGGITSFGPSIYSGRVLMLLMQIGSTLMVYAITRRVSGSIFAASFAALAFCLSAWGTYYHRRILLDNIATFWMLLSIVLLLSPRLTLRKVWLSATALAVSVLSKELTIFLVPVLAYLVFNRSHPGQRAFAVATWSAIVVNIISLYALMAILKGELLPAGTLWFENSHPHTSLLGALQYQGARGKDGGILNGKSAFWEFMYHWVRSDPLLVVGGLVASALSILRWRWNRLVAIMGLVTVSLVAFLGRSGEVLGFYLVPLLPIFAINIGISLAFIVACLRRAAVFMAPRRRLFQSVVALSASGVLALLGVPGVLAGYHSTELSFASNPLQLWTSVQAQAQVQAIDWVRTHLQPNKCVIVDDFMWTDLVDGFNNAPKFTCLHWYWKVDRDKAIEGPVFHDRWQTVDYIVATEQLVGDTKLQRRNLTVVYAALLHSVVIKHFDTGGWPIDILKVDKGPKPIAAFVTAGTPAHGRPALSPATQNSVTNWHPSATGPSSTGFGSSMPQALALARSQLAIADQQTAGSAGYKPADAAVPPKAEIKPADSAMPPRVGLHSSQSSKHSK